MGNPTKYQRGRLTHFEFHLCFFFMFKIFEADGKCQRNFCRQIILVFFLFLFQENGFCIKDPSKKYCGQTITPRHTIDAILGLNDRIANIEGETQTYTNTFKTYTHII